MTAQGAISRAPAPLGISPRADLSGCRACELLENADRRYLGRVLPDPTREAVQAQAIADSLGFCARHAAHVADCEGEFAAIARVLRGAIELTLEILDAGKANNEITRDILFQSANACPACTYSARQLTRNLARAGAHANNGAGAPAALCFAHYRDAIGLTDAARLVAVARAELGRMKTVIGSPPTLDASALRALSGDRALLPDAPLGCELLKRRGDEVEVWDAQEACPVCIGMARDLQTRFDFARWALRIGSDGWIVLPTCREHLWLFARFAGAQAAELASEYSVTAIAGLLRSGIAAVVRGRRRRAIEARSVWYKPRSPSFLLGLEREAVSRAPRCPVCGGLAVTREREVGRFLELLTQRGSTRDLEKGYGLCMKHFASVFLFVRKGPTRDALAMVQREKLSALHRTLSERPLAAYKDAVYRFSGWM